MTRSLNILMLSKDPTLFASDKSTFGDTLKRHILYAEILRNKYPDSEIRIISYAATAQKAKSGQVSAGLKIYATNSFTRAVYLFGIFKLLPTVLADGWRPDVVTVQSSWEEGPLGYLIARFLKAKFISQAFFDVTSVDWKNEHWLNPWRQMVSYWLFSHADCIRVVSSAQQANLSKHLGILPERIRVIPVGVNFQPVLGPKEVFKKRIAKGLETKKVVLFVARFHPQKNVSLWVDVAEEVSRIFPEAAFVMVGNGPIFNDIQAKVRQKGLTDRFYFLGNLGYEQLPEAYAAADLFLLSSDYEGLCRVLVESYLAGVPVVSTASGAEDVIIDGETGFILPCGDRRGLSSAVVQLLQDDEMRERFGHLGKEKVSAQFSLEALSCKLIESWESA